MITLTAPTDNNRAGGSSSLPLAKLSRTRADVIEVQAEQERRAASIPVAMRGNEQNVIIQNIAPGIDIQQQVTPQGIVLTVQSMLKDYSKQIPGILSDA